MIPFTLRQLEYVVAVADERSFRGAAAACHVSQPALSTQIAQLEDVLGVRLFERDRRGVLITEAGADVVARARAILTAADDLRRVGQRFGRPLEGTLRLGVIPTIAPYALPQVLPHLRQRYPQLRLFLREDHTEDLIVALAEGRLDVLLLAEEADLGPVETTLIARDPFVLAVPHDHPLASRKRVREEDLEGEPVLVLEDGHCFGDQALDVCQRGGATAEGDFRAASLTTLVQMVAGGTVITLLPQLAVEVENRSQSLVTKPFRKRGPARHIVLAWRPSSPCADSYRELAEELRRAWPI